MVDGPFSYTSKRAPSDLQITPFIVRPALCLLLRLQHIKRVIFQLHDIERLAHCLTCQQRR